MDASSFKPGSPPGPTPKSNHITHDTQNSENKVIDSGQSEILQSTQDLTADQLSNACSSHIQSEYKNRKSSSIQSRRNSQSNPALLNSMVSDDRKGPSSIITTLPQYGAWADSKSDSPPSSSKKDMSDTGDETESQQEQSAVNTSITVFEKMLTLGEANAIMPPPKTRYFLVEL